jgi:hypothetical protein
MYIGKSVDISLMDGDSEMLMVEIEWREDRMVISSPMKWALWSIWVLSAFIVGLNKMYDETSYSILIRHPDGREFPISNIIEDEIEYISDFLRCYIMWNIEGVSIHVLMEEETLCDMYGVTHDFQRSTL